jgi:hypothetical protein
VSTPTMCREIVGLGPSAEILILPTCAAQFRQRCNTIAPSWPGIGERTVPWFRAASRAGVRACNASTSGASADRINVFSNRSSLQKRCASDASTLPSLTEDIADEGHIEPLPCGHGATSCRLAIVHDSSRRRNNPMGAHRKWSADSLRLFNPLAVPPR